LLLALDHDVGALASRSSVRATGDAADDAAAKAMQQGR
jgi:hypothetical protein